MLEPRGAPIGSVNLLLPAKNPKADAGFVILQPDQAHASSGSNSICITTALLESGIVEMSEPETTVVLDTAAGLVTATATCRDSRCERVKLTMVPSFVHELDVSLETAEWGRITRPQLWRHLLRTGRCRPGGPHHRQGQCSWAGRGRDDPRKVNRRIPVVHPEIPAISGVAYVMFRDVDPDGAIRTCTTMWPGRVDRSPCGTGNSANLATLHARGKAKVGDVLKSRSIIGSNSKSASRK